MCGNCCGVDRQSLGKGKQVGAEQGPYVSGVALCEKEARLAPRVVRIEQVARQLLFLDDGIVRIRKFRWLSSSRSPCASYSACPDP